MIQAASSIPVRHPFVLRDFDAERMEARCESERYYAGVRAKVAKAGKRAEKTDIAKHLGRVAEAAQIKIDATAASRECFDAVRDGVMMDEIIRGLEGVCARWDVDLPEAISGKQAEIINKTLDENWWRRHLRKRAVRNLEYWAIQSGIVGKGKQAYISDEACIRQATRNRENRRMLEAAQIANETGFQCSVAELADKGMGNKENRRHELMTRIRGMEEVAETLNHAALFWTVTCPSKFHSVGGTNPKYNGASPREAQEYLCGQWAKVRAALDREGIRPYGFRVVEPHTDGCPHWHMLYFVERKHVQRMARIVHKYALEVDGNEPGAAENRVKLVTISRGNGGSAAGYIAKYIAKNIDGFGVGEHKAFEHGEEFTVGASDFDGLGTITPSMRVTYWSQVWGIRQFQQIGAVPVGIWREFRKIEAGELEAKDAPQAVRDAWEAAQAEKDEEGNVTKQADFGAFMRALGGPLRGRDTLVKLQRLDVEISGRYASYWGKKPIGVYAAENPFKTYESVRYEWRLISGPRTGVNNCTGVDYPGLQKRFTDSSETLFAEAKNKKFKAPLWVDWRGIRQEAREIEKRDRKSVV